MPCRRRGSAIPGLPPGPRARPRCATDRPAGSRAANAASRASRRRSPASADLAAAPAVGLAATAAAIAQPSASWPSSDAPPQSSSYRRRAIRPTEPRLDSGQTPATSRSAALEEPLSRHNRILEPDAVRPAPDHARHPATLAPPPTTPRSPRSGPRVMACRSSRRRRGSSLAPPAAASRLASHQTAMPRLRRSRPRRSAASSAPGRNRGAATAGPAWASNRHRGRSTGSPASAR